VTMQTQHKQHFLVSEASYWRDICLSLDYQERLYCEGLGCSRMDVLENSGDMAVGMKRRLRFEKPIEAPAPVRKLFGDSVIIQEESEFDANTQRWSFNMIPPLFADRIEIRGVVSLEPVHDGIQQVSANTVSCRIFGVGGIIEHFVAKSAHEGNHQKAEFTRRYIREKGLR
jgi:hypothetical protein